MPNSDIMREICYNKAMVIIEEHDNLYNSISRILIVQGRKPKSTIEDIEYSIDLIIELVYQDSLQRGLNNLST